MIPTTAEPIVIHLGSVEDVCQQEYPIGYAHSFENLRHCFHIMIVRTQKDTINSIS